MLIQPERAENICNAAFQGAQLESFEARSIEMIMTFMNSDSSGRLCQFRVSSLNSVDPMAPDGSDFRNDFHTRRKLLLSELYGLLGEYVSSAKLDDVQRLIISFTNDSSLIFSNEPEVDFDPLAFNWHIDFDDGWECAPGIQSLSCVVSETQKPEFFERVE